MSGVNNLHLYDGGTGSLVYLALIFGHFTGHFMLFLTFHCVLMFNLP